MLQALFGSSEKDKPPPTAADIKSFVKTHNALYRHGRLRGIRPRKKE